VGLERGAVHRDRAQLDQAHLVSQAHDLHESSDRSLGCNARNSRIVRCAGKLPAASTLKATSSRSFVATLCELNTPVAGLVARVFLVVAGVERLPKACAATGLLLEPARGHLPAALRGLVWRLLVR
jgi:hypothetical protein